MATVEQGKTFEIAKVFGRAFETLGAHGGLYFTLSALFTGIPAFMMRWLLVQSGAVEDPATIFTLLGTSEFLTPYLILMLVATITDAALQGGLIHATGRSQLGKPVSITDCLEVGFTRLLPVAALNLIIVISVCLASLLLLVPGIILGTCWYVATAANVEERAGIGNALQRSVELTRGVRWHIFFLLLVVLVVSYVVSTVIGNIGRAVGDTSTLAILVETLFQIVSRVVWITVSACFYFELRRLKDGAPRDELETVFS